MPQNQNQNQQRNHDDPRREERDNRQQNLSTAPPNATRAASTPRDNDLAKPSEEWNRAENTGQIQQDGAQGEAMQNNTQGNNVRNTPEKGARADRSNP